VVDGCIKYPQLAELLAGLNASIGSTGASNACSCSPNRHTSMRARSRARAISTSARPWSVIDRLYADGPAQAVIVAGS
jgi:hypothetical protein